MLFSVCKVYMYHLTGMHMSLTCPLTKNSAIHPSPQSLLIQQLNRLHLFLFEISNKSVLGIISYERFVWFKMIVLITLILIIINECSNRINPSVQIVPWSKGCCKNYKVKTNHNKIRFDSKKTFSLAFLRRGLEILFCFRLFIYYIFLCFFRLVIVIVVFCILHKNFIT